MKKEKLTFPNRADLMYSTVKKIPVWAQKVSLSLPLKISIDDVINSRINDLRDSKFYWRNAISLIQGYQKGERKGYYPIGYTKEQLYLLSQQTIDGKFINDRYGLPFARILRRIAKSKIKSLIIRVKNIQKRDEQYV